jgi:hypothetical protein
MCAEHEYRYIYHKTALILYSNSSDFIDGTYVKVCLFNAWEHGCPLKWRQ